MGVTRAGGGRSRPRLVDVDGPSRGAFVRKCSSSKLRPIRERFAGLGVARGPAAEVEAKTGDRHVSEDCSVAQPCARTAAQELPLRPEAHASAEQAEAPTSALAMHPIVELLGETPAAVVASLASVGSGSAKGSALFFPEPSRIRPPELRRKRSATH